MMGLVILQNKSMSASSAIASIVYSLLQKPYLKARLRKELTSFFNSAERKPTESLIRLTNSDTVESTKFESESTDFQFKSLYSPSVAKI